MKRIFAFLIMFVLISSVISVSAAKEKDLDFTKSIDLSENDKINYFNDLIKSKNKKWTAGKTSVSHLSLEEKKALLSKAKLKSDKNIPLLKTVSQGAYPSSLDWRDNNGNWVTSVKDQLSCGSCWAFGAINVVESRINIALNNPDYNIDLSEQNLVSCSGAGNCYDGGFYNPALEYIKTDGIVKESCFPYTAIDADGCDGLSCEYTPVLCSNKCGNWENELVKVIDYNVLPASIPEIKQAINDYGPITVYMEIYDDFFSYTEGIYDTLYFADNFHWLGYHAVSIIGYNDIDEYWIGKNSWDTGWGEGGYFKISYNAQTFNFDPDFFTDGYFFLDESYVVTSTDVDNDNIDDSVDNCFEIPNSDQLDTDVDDVGDVCDLDDDEDSVLDVDDNCPLIQNSDQLDTDEDGAGNVCDLDDDNDGLTDIDEEALGTDPLNPDTDEDTFNDNVDTCPLIYGVDNGCPDTNPPEILLELSDTLVEYLKPVTITCTAIDDFDLIIDYGLTMALPSGTNIDYLPLFDLKNYPEPFIVDGTFEESTVIVVGDDAPASDVLAAIDIATKLQFLAKVDGIDPIPPDIVIDTKLASEVTNPEDYNLILVGNPANNPLVESFGVTSANWDLVSGEALLKFVENGNKIALIVAGTETIDTRMAAKVVVNSEDYGFSGKEVKISGDLTNPIVSSIPLVFTYQDTDEEGIYSVECLGTDDFGNTNTANAQFVVEINDAPEIVGVIPDQEQDEDVEWSLDLSDYKSDVDDPVESLYWTVSGDYESLFEIFDDEDVLIFTPVENANGFTTITLTLKDLKGAMDTQDILVTINPVNDVPEVSITSPEDGFVFNIAEEGIFLVSFSGTATDVEDDDLTASLKWYDFEVLIGSGASFNYELLVGRHEINARVTDSDDASMKDKHIIYINTEGNTVPTANAGDDLSVYVGDLVTLNGIGTDSENNTLSYSWEQSSGEFIFELSDFSIANPTFTPTETGTYVFDLTINDGILDGFDSVSITVSEKPAPPSPSSSGGSGGGGTKIGGGEIIITTISQTVVLKTSNRVVYSVNGGGHYVTLDSVSDDHVTVRVHSDPFNVDLYEGKTEKVDSDGNGINDLLMRLENIFSTSAKVTFKVIKEVSVSTTPSEESVEGKTGIEDITGAVTGEGDLSGLFKALILIGSLVVFVSGYTLLHIKKPHITYKIHRVPRRMFMKFRRIRF